MSFHSVIEYYRNFDVEGFFDAVTPDSVKHAVESEHPGPLEFLTLLSPTAAYLLESMACKAHRLTVQHFGRTVQLFIPLYISNYCKNECVYCGFNSAHPIERSRLSLGEIEAEARAIARTGMRPLLVLTGEARQITPPDYLESAIRILGNRFASVSIEMFPMNQDEYESLIRCGADGLTLYQETYDPDIYRRIHGTGPKADYDFRLTAPDRGARAGFRAVNIGALLGLGESRRETFFLGLHAAYLLDRYPAVEVGISLPRINPAEGGYRPAHPVNDRLLVQFMLAWRIFLPRVGITVSTRERAVFRDRLIKLGATRFSAGSRTGVGGYRTQDPPRACQFEISDLRDVDQFISAVEHQGYQPVYKDWDRIA